MEMETGKTKNNRDWCQHATNREEWFSILCTWDPKWRIPPWCIRPPQLIPPADYNWKSWTLKSKQSRWTIKRCQNWEKWLTWVCCPILFVFPHMRQCNKGGPHLQSSMQSKLQQKLSFWPQKPGKMSLQTKMCEGTVKKNQAKKMIP